MRTSARLSWKVKYSNQHSLLLLTPRSRIQYCFTILWCVNNLSGLGVYLVKGLTFWVFTELRHSLRHESRKTNGMSATVRPSTSWHRLSIESTYSVNSRILHFVKGQESKFEVYTSSHQSPRSNIVNFEYVEDVGPHDSIIIHRYDTGVSGWVDAWYLIRAVKPYSTYNRI